MCPKVSPKHKEATRRRILEAARGVFARRGYTGASLDEIGRECGLTKGAIYVYFDSKEELFLALEDLVHQPTTGDFLAPVLAARTARERLTRAGKLVFDNQAHLDRDTLRVMYEFWTQAPRLKAIERVYRSRYNGTQRFLAALLREGVTQGEFREDVDPDVLASMLMATIEGLCLYWAAIGIEFDWERLEKTLFSVVLDGIAQPLQPAAKQRPR